MKHILQTIGLIIVSLLISSCAVEETPVVEEKEDITFTVSPSEIPQYQLQEGIAAVQEEQKDQTEEIEALKDLIEIADQRTKTAEIISHISQKDTRVILQIKIRNPAQEEITSVRSWVTYNPNQLEVVKIDTDRSDYDLAAPGENEVDLNLGIIKLGRSKTDGGITDEYSEIATVMFVKKDEGISILDYFDYTGDAEGHVSVNVFTGEGKIPVNILKSPKTPAGVIN